MRFMTCLAVLSLVPATAYGAGIRLDAAIIPVPTWSSQAERKLEQIPNPPGGLNTNLLMLKQLEAMKLPGRLDIIGFGLSRTDHMGYLSIKNSLVAGNGLRFKFLVTN